MEAHRGLLWLRRLRHGGLRRSRRRFYGSGSTVAPTVVATRVVCAPDTARVMALTAMDPEVPYSDSYESRPSRRSEPSTADINGSASYGLAAATASLR